MTTSRRLVEMRLDEIQRLLTVLGLKKIRSTEPRELRSLYTPLNKIGPIHQLHTYGRDDSDILVQIMMIDKKVMSVWIVRRQDARYHLRRKRIVHFPAELANIFSPAKLT